MGLEERLKVRFECSEEEDNGYGGQGKGEEKHR